MSPFKFFQAVITSTRPLYLNGEYFYKNTNLGVAKYKDDLWIVAFNDTLFSILPTEDLQGYIKTRRDQNNKPRPVPGGFNITGTENAFKFKVQAGHTCPDGCCGDDSPHLTETFNSPKEATERFNTLVREDYNRPMDFVRAYGPGLSLRNWNRPRD